MSIYLKEQNGVSRLSNDQELHTLFFGSIIEDGTYNLDYDVNNFKLLYVCVFIGTNIASNNIVPYVSYSRESIIGVPVFTNTNYYIQARAIFKGSTMKVCAFARSGFTNGYIGRVYGQTNI